MLAILPGGQELRGMFDIKNWLAPNIVDIKKHSKVGNFWFIKSSNTSKVDMFYKKNSDHKWKHFPSGMFKTNKNRIARPAGKPKTILPTFSTSDIDLQSIRKNIDVCKKYFSSVDKYNAWVKLLNYWDKLANSISLQRQYSNGNANWFLPNIPKCNIPTPNMPMPDPVVDALLTDECANPQVNFSKFWYNGKSL